MEFNIKIEPISDSELKPKYTLEEKLGFGKVFTNRMFYLEYRGGRWELENAVIKKYDKISLDPSAICLHYGQTIFEGMKAYRTSEGHINLFRPEKNAARFNSSARRIMMPELPPEVFLKALKTLITIEKDWAPKSHGSSLYIRPTMIGIQAGLGVRPSKEYLFYILLSPSGPYFPEGFKCIRIYVSENYIRAAPGGTGNAKTGGNYAASLLVGNKATEKGFKQVLWLDSTHRKYVEEVGAMNIFFVYDNIIYTAPLTSGTILAGVTRESIIQIANDFGFKVKEEALAIEVIIEGIHNGKVSEIFGCGTAASIAPVGSLYWKNEEHFISNFEIGEITKTLYKELTDIQYGRKKDPYNWIFQVV